MEFGPFLFFLFLGLEFGSFANVCIYRWPRNQSILRPTRSHCPWCKKKISWFDNIPVLSFLLLRGKCRSCSSEISWRYPFIELLMGGLWLIGLYLSQSLKLDSPFIFLLIFNVFTFVMVVTTMTDLDWKIIPDEMSIGLMVFAVIVSPWNEFLGPVSLIQRFGQSVVGLILGGLVLVLISGFGKLIFKKETMGGGDIKLLAGIGALLGWKSAVLSLMLGSIIGGVFALFGLLFGFLKRHQYIPFGPFINLGAVVIFMILLFFPEVFKFTF